MWIRFGENEKIQALGAFDEHAYQDGGSRRVLRMRLLALPTPAQLEAIFSGPITVTDKEGGLIATYEGFNAVYDCNLTLGVYGPGELELLAAKAREDSAALEASEARALAAQAEAALAAVQAQAAQAAAQAEADLADVRAELAAAKSANAALLAAQPENTEGGLS